MDTQQKDLNKLFLDDVRDPDYVYDTNNEEWIIIRSYEDFVSYIEENGIPDIISFDHDLGDNIEKFEKSSTGILYPKEDEDLNKDEKTGLDAAKWLVEYCMDNDIKYINFKVHSDNTPGRKNIKSLLNNFNETMKERN